MTILESFMAKDALSIIDNYLLSFRSRRNEFSHKAIRILTALKQELTGQAPELSLVYTDLGFHYWLNFFDTVNISGEELPSYLLMQKFIDELKQSGTTSTLTALLQRFEADELTPALNRYEEALFSSLTTLNQFSLAKLKAIYNAFEICLENHLGSRLKLIQTKGTKIIEGLEQQYNEKGLTLELIKGGFNAAIDVASENKDLVIITMFMTQFHLIVTKPQSKTTDLLSLREIAKEAQQHLLAMPEIKEVKQFHWLINLFCNFVNNYIVNAFESQQIKDVNRFFTQLNSEMHEAESQQNRAGITSYKSMR